MHISDDVPTRVAGHLRQVDQRENRGIESEIARIFNSLPAYRGPADERTTVNRMGQRGIQDTVRTKRSVRPLTRLRDGTHSNCIKPIKTVAS